MRKIVSFIILAAFCTNFCVPPSYAQVFMPKAGEMVGLSPAFHPPILTGVKVYTNDPFHLDFIMDKGQGAGVSSDAADRLIKYFLASLTVPEKDLWVNLSPYERGRIVPDAFGMTGMGRDLLAQDYLLKQITSSLMYPEDELGKKFWSEIYKQAQEQFGTTDIPVDTFNKVWIVPSKAVVYERPVAAGAALPDEAVAYVVGSRLKVMLESDYLAMEHNGVGVASGHADMGANPMSSELMKDVIRQVIIPALEKEVNEGRNFAPLRQVYNSLILASWYKKKIKESILSKVYVDRKKVQGVNIDDPKEAQKIWAQYVEAFKKGVFDLVKEEEDQYTQEMVPRKYFAGGVTFMAMDGVMDVSDNAEGMVTPEEALLIKMSLREEPVEGDMPEGNPIFFPQDLIYQSVVEAAPRLKDVFTEYGFGSGPEIIAEFGKIFKILHRQGMWDIDALVASLSEQLSEERAALSARPGYVESSLTRIFGGVAGLLRGDAIDLYTQRHGQEIVTVQGFLKRWAGIDIDPESVFFDYRLDWNGSVRYRHSQFIRMSFLPVQYGVSVPVLLHEEWHHVARGFDTDWLNEAVTQRLSLETLGLEGFSIPDSFRAKYFKEQEMLRVLSKVTGGYAPIILAYATGETLPLFNLLGPNADLVWRLMAALDDVYSANILKDKMLHAILSNLDSRERLMRIGDVLLEGNKTDYDDPFSILPFIAQDLKKPLVPSKEIAEIRRKFLSRPVSENILLERTISAYIEGLDEKDIFVKEGDLSMASFDAAAATDEKGFHFHDARRPEEAQAVVAEWRKVQEQADREHQRIFSLVDDRNPRVSRAYAIRDKDNRIVGIVGYSYHDFTFDRRTTEHNVPQLDLFEVLDVGKTGTFIRVLWAKLMDELQKSRSFNRTALVLQTDRGVEDFPPGFQIVPASVSYIKDVDLMPFLSMTRTNAGILFKKAFQWLNGGPDFIQKDAAEAVPLMDRLKAFMKGDPNEVPGGVDAMQNFIDAFDKPRSPLAVYKDRMAEYLKEEEELAFKLAPVKAGDAPTMLKIFLGDEDPFEGRDFETFDAPIFGMTRELDAFSPVMVVDAKTAWAQGRQHWKWSRRSMNNAHWSDWNAEEAVGFIEQTFLEGKPTQEEVDHFITRIKDDHGYKPIGNWDVAHAPIRCALDDKDRRFYLMDPGAVRKIKNSDRAEDISGGIDLTAGSAQLQTMGSGAGMEFKFDPAEVRRLQAVPGFVPVIMDIQLMNDLPEFLGLTAQLN